MKAKSWMVRGLLLAVPVVVTLLLTNCDYLASGPDSDLIDSQAALLAPQPDREAEISLTSADPARLTILHTNDVHAHVLQFNKYGAHCSPEETAQSACFGGVARLATEVAHIRAEHGNLLLLDAGDQFQGSLFYNRFKGRVAARFMSRLGYQAMTLGNHEFDDGPDNLAQFARQVNFPLVCANLDASAEPELAAHVKPYVILHVGGARVGVIGALSEETPEISVGLRNSRVLPAEPAIRKAVRELTAQGVDRIILLSHLGLGVDREIGESVDGLDVIVGGHSHSLLSSSDPGALGPYPIALRTPNGGRLLIVTTDGFGKSLGRLDVVFDRRGHVMDWSGKPRLLDAAVEEDQEVLGDAMQIWEKLSAFTDQCIGRAERRLDGGKESCLFGECPLGNLIADALLWSTQPQGARIAVYNGGGIRSGLPDGEISLGAVMEVLPFGNTISVFSLTGADLKAALEHGVSRVTEPEMGGTGRFLQVAGLRYRFRPARASGSRITSVEIRGEDGEWTPLDEQATYRLATNIFLKRGGDGFTMFAERALDAYDFGRRDCDVVADYIRQHSPIHPNREGRVVREE